jgi:MYXO-CTERM domain-containing protein
MRTNLGVTAMLSVLSAVLFTPAAAHAFCGFYVSGADGSLYADATMVVMMREGTRTVLSMQNSYQGPPEDFALVVPVPTVLREENVKTLPREIFQHVDQLAAPRLVEYWEQDPCYVEPEYEAMEMSAPSGAGMAAPTTRAAADLGVRVEAQFAVAEYDIVILSARDSSGLDTWLRQERYNIPEGAGEVLRPYVEQGTKFFVAKVDVERVTFVEGKAVLSPLRVHYDSPDFSLPVRLGLLNSQGQQDLIVHILARGQRYEVANYTNAFIPTNIRVVDAVRQEFGGFYEALFRETVARHRNAVVTEYAWDASSCDPCPTPALDPSSIETLGGDVVPGDPYGFVLTRLHYRYTPQSLGEDLVFRPAPPVYGGRGIPNQQGDLEEEGAQVQEGGMNNFQGRYVMLNFWEGEMACESPVRGRWGGPPNGGQPPPVAAPSSISRSGANLAPAALGVLVAEDIPELGVIAGQPSGEGSSTPTAVDRGPAGAGAGGGGGCASCTVTGGAAPWGALALGVLGLAALFARRRNRG